MLGVISADDIVLIIVLMFKCTSTWKNIVITFEYYLEWLIGSKNWKVAYVYY